MISNLFLLFVMAAQAAPLKVLTSTTDIAWLVRQIGGEKVEVTSLLRGTENPHYIDAVPEFIRLAADAQMVCVVGLDLEVGWMPKVLSKSGNAKVQPGGLGYCEAAKGITVLERQDRPVDRSMGDIHPSGNPHFWVSPDAFSESANEILRALVNNDGANAPFYRSNLQKVQTILAETKKRNLAKLKPFLTGTGTVMVEYHKEFSYFSKAFGLQSLGSLEEKPGITPSAGRLAEVATQAKAAGVRFLLAGDTAPKKTIGKFKELSSIPIVVVPLSLRASGKPSEYPEFVDGIVDAIVAALKETKTP